MKNLQEFNINSVSAMGEISFDEAGYEQLSSVLREHQENRRRRNIDKLGFYEIDGVRHHVGLELEIVGRTKPKNARFMLGAHTFPASERLRASTRDSQARQLSEIEAILSDLGGLNLTSRLHSHVSWSFQPDSKKTIIELPMITIQNPSLPFTEISGIRFRKVTDEGMTTVTIDLMRDRSLLVTLVSPLLGITISANMIDYMVKQSTQIIDEFIFDKDIPFEDRGNDL